MPLVYCPGQGYTNNMLRVCSQFYVSNILLLLHQLVHHLWVINYEKNGPDLNRSEDSRRSVPVDGSPCPEYCSAICKIFFAFNDLKLISGWSVWLILKTNIHLITINNHLSGDRRSLARVWIFKSVQCAWSRWSSLWSPKKMKIWRIQKNRVSAESENVLWFVRQHDFNAKNCEISKILSCHSVSTQVFAWKPAPIWLVLKIRAYLGMPFTIISAKNMVFITVIKSGRLKT